MVRIEVYVTCDKCRQTFSILITADGFGEFQSVIWSQLKREGWGRQVKSTRKSKDICPDCLKEVE